MFPAADNLPDPLSEPVPAAEGPAEPLIQGDDPPAEVRSAAETCAIEAELAADVDEDPGILPLEDAAGDEGWSGADIEEAYLKALSAMEDLPPELDPAAEVTPAAAEPPDADGLPGPDDSQADPQSAADSQEVLSGKMVPTDDIPTAPVAAVAQAVPADVGAAGTAPATTPRLARGTERAPRPEPREDYSNVSPAQVIEAALFVGGSPLTAKKLVALLHSSADVSSVEQTIDELNTQYATQARPYEIRHGEGGYRLELREEFDRLRHRVYGTGPREVRLAQDVLEVLALVAYRQPISQKEIESHGKQNAGNLLRQLLRRELISFERGPGGRKDLIYHTTPRFLSVFGISSLDDLPQAEDLAHK